MTFLHTCSCGKQYTLEEWFRLFYVGEQKDVEGMNLELRQCECGSTRGVLIRDLGAAIDAAEEKETE